MLGARTALITGVAGQDGIYLARLLLKRGYRVIGTTTSAIGSSPYLQGVEIIGCDIRDTEGIARVLRLQRPDEIYNLAAVSSVGLSWQMAEQVAEVNGMSVLRLLELLVRLRDKNGYEPRLFHASSAEVFGVAADQPQSERTPLNPCNPYGIAKAFAHHSVANYRDSHGLFVCNGILFNHESPIRPARFVTRKITRAAAEISLGLRERLTLGNLDARRDWGSAAEYVVAMSAMLQLDSPRDLVIASGTVASIRDFLTIAFVSAGIEDPWSYVDFDLANLRAMDVPQSWGDPGKAASDLGWKPTASLRDVIGLMVRADTVRATTGIEECCGYMFAETVGDVMGLNPETHLTQCPHCVGAVA